MDRGAQICGLVEAATGAACPCRAGRVCPLVGGELRTLRIVHYQSPEAATPASLSVSMSIRERAART